MAKKESNDKKKNDKPWYKKTSSWILVGILIFLMIFSALIQADKQGNTGTLSYLDFMSDLENGYIDSVSYTAGSIFAEVYYKEGLCQEDILDEYTGEVRELTIINNQRVEKVLNPSDEDFFKTIAEHGVEIKILSTSSTKFISIVAGAIPTILLIGCIVWMMKMQFGGGGKDPTAQKAQKSTTKFSDVAGMTEEKEELLFAIKSLQKKDEYLEKGVKPVRGILLEGPPGVGKTLLAKAVAGEAGVNFLSYSGADFVELFVGMGARRVRTMYETAEKMKPCVVFIDEIDALGRKRAGGGNPGNQEADQTLIALLEKMDGMNTTSGILFIAATNRVDSLDSALLRPGRFDKTIHVSPPKTKEDREAIVEVHSKGKVFEDGVTTEKIAKQCYGLTGAEIASALNDAVLESFKADREGIISLDDIDKAIMKLFAKGLAKGRHSEKDMYRVAVHEAGHAVMNKALERSVVKVSIQPYSSGVGGVTQIDGENSGLDGLMTKTDIINSIKVLYAGKVAEETILGECSVGASNDLERATFAIRDYIGTYGMSDNNLLSLVGLGRENMMITANEKLLEDMQKVANEVYSQVVNYFSTDEVKKIVQNLADYLVESEVIYDFDLAYEQAAKGEPIVLENKSLSDVDKANEISLEKEEVAVEKAEGEDNA